LGAGLQANGFAAAAEQAYATATTLDTTNARWWYRLALLQSRLGDQAAALVSLDRALRLEPAYAPAHARRGIWLLDRGSVDDAESAFRRVLEIDAIDPSGSIGLARVFLARGENQQAIDTLEQLLDHQPGNRYALQLLGTAYRRLGREDDARLALAMGAGHEQTIRDPWLDDLATARRGFAARLKEATAQAMGGDFAAAIPLLEQLRTERPNDIGLMTHLGGIYAAAGRLAEATLLLEAVLGREADNFDAHVNLAHALVRQGALERASVHAERAVAIRPTSARAHETKGMVEWRSGRPAEATVSFERALALDPRNQQPRAWIGWIFLDQQQSAPALHHFEQALAIDPLVADALVGIGVLQVRIGALEQAQLSFRRAEQIDPANARLRAAIELLPRAAKE
jgi:Flp pilus assembly protein TadD